MSFEKLGLTEMTLRAIRSEGYHTATPIQIKAIPPVLTGRDLMGCAQTGTGKTAAFALPTIERLARPKHHSASATHHGKDKPHRQIRLLVLTPTRELAAQIADSFAVYGRFSGLRHAVIFGGVGQHPQVKLLRAGVDILVATPGRLLDLMGQGHVDLSNIEILILDEADQMLDLGFIEPLRKIVAKVPRRRQTLMFSATMPPEIRKLAHEWLREPVSVQVAPVATPAEKVEQSVYHVTPEYKPPLLAKLLKSNQNERTIVFTRTKRGADRVAKYLNASGISADSIHGDKSQGARQNALTRFKSSNPPVLVATDIAARGLDIDRISHVFNYDLPNVPEVYVHRIGRTGRAGAEGIAISFCIHDERSQLRDIEKLTRQSIPVEPLPSDLPPPPPKKAPAPGSHGRPHGRSPSGVHVRTTGALSGGTSREVGGQPRGHRGPPSKPKHATGPNKRRSPTNKKRQRFSTAKRG